MEEKVVKGQEIIGVFSNKKSIFFEIKKNLSAFEFFALQSVFVTSNAKITSFTNNILFFCLTVNFEIKTVKIN